MKISRYILTIALTIFLALPVAAQVNDTYIVPAAASLSGAGGTYWLTSAYVFNPHGHTLFVSITFLRTRGAIGDEILLEVPPNSTAVTDDIIGEWFDTSGGGSLLFATFPEDNPHVEDNAISRSFTVRTRTYNDNFTGTYGQGVPGEWVGLFDFEYDGITSIAEGVWNQGTTGFSGYRTNVGAVNLGYETIKLLVTVYDAAGNVVDDTFDHPLEFLVHPYAHEQQRLPIFGIDLTLEFLVDDPTQEAVVFPYVSIVDNRSGDATYVYPRLLASAGILYGGGAATQAQSSFGRTGDSFTAKPDGEPRPSLDIELARKIKELTERKAIVREGVRLPM